MPSIQFVSVCVCVCVCERERERERERVGGFGEWGWVAITAITIFNYITIVGSLNPLNQASFTVRIITGYSTL